MNRIILTILILSSFLHCCNTKYEAIVRVRIAYDVEIPKCNELQSNNLLKPKLYISGNDTTLSYIDYRNKKLRFWSLSRQSYTDSIDINIYNHQFIQDYFIISHDSIMLAFNTSYFLSKHDDCIGIFNREKETLGRMSFIGAPVQLNSNQSPYVSKSNFYYSDYTYFPLFLFERKSVASLAHYNQVYCDEELPQEGPISLGLIHLDKSKRFQSIPIAFDCSERGVYYPVNFKFPRGAVNGNMLYIGFGNEPKIFSYDMHTNKIISSHIAFQSIDIPLYSTISTKGKAFDLSKPEFIDIVYNSAKSQLMWFARLPIDSNVSPIHRNYPRYCFAIINDKLGKEAEGLLPFGCEPPIIPYREGFLVYNKFKSNNKNKTIYSYCVYEYQRTKHGLIKNEISDNGDNLDIKKDVLFSNYIQSLSIDCSEFNKFLIIPLDNSCESCIIKLSNELKSKAESLSMKKTVVILICSNTQITHEFLSASNLLEQTQSFVFIDNNETFKRYLDDWVNPRLFKVDKFGRIVFDKIYNPEDMTNLIYDLN